MSSAEYLLCTQQPWVQFLASTFQLNVEIAASRCMRKKIVESTSFKMSIEPMHNV